MENNRPNQQPGNPFQPERRTPGKFKFNFSWIYGLIIVILLGSLFLGDGGAMREVSYSKFEDLVKSGSVERVRVFTSRNTLEAKITPEAAKELFGDSGTGSPMGDGNRSIVVSIPSVEVVTDFMQQAREQHGYTGEVDYKEGRNYFEMFLYSFLPILLLIFFIVYMNRRMMSQAGGGGGGVFSVGRSKAQLFDKSSANKVTFKDVAGLEGAKQEVEEIVSFLKNPSKYTQLGGKIPKGALLVGPPGTGKTLLAKAVAGEADVPFFSMSGSDFVEMFVGVGASRVRDLFRQAKEKAPCIIFIDEIDAIGRARGRNPNMGANDERENTLNQLLTEMDGFGTNSGVIILAATNRADILDKALLRAGRFDRQIHVDLPDIQERKEIFNVHLRPIKIDESVDVDFLAKQTPGFSKNKIMTLSEKRSIACHEAGHATISWKLEHANPLVKVTIVPRGEALGAAWYLPEERQLTNEEHLLDEMCSTLGGRAAEELFLHQVSTGALNDLERVTKRAYGMVAYFGMSAKLPNMSYYDSTGQSDYGFTKPYSEKTAELIDTEAKKIVAEQYERAKKILEENAEGHNRLAELLMEREVIFAEDLEKIFGPRPWTSRSDELMAMNEESKKQPKSTEDLPSNDSKTETPHE